MATRLASSPTSDTWPNHISVSGANASVMLHWVRSRPTSLPQPRAWASESSAISTPTATKLSQKPGCSQAQGSQTSTTAMTTTPTTGQGQRRPSKRKPHTTASISTVRCAGMPHPENTAYASASTPPPQSAATGAGQASSRRLPQRADNAGAQRQAHPTSQVHSQAHKVMCKPEMLTRWATPVARNTSQSAESIAAWSPTTSAASKPAARSSATCCRIWLRKCSRSGCNPYRAAARRTGGGSVAVMRTVPEAPSPSLHIHSSVSKPWGLARPCGWRRRTASCQRSPACGTAPPSWARQLSVTRPGKPAAGAATGACHRAADGVRVPAAVSWAGSGHCTCST